METSQVGEERVEEWKSGRMEEAAFLPLSSAHQRLPSCKTLLDEFKDAGGLVIEEWSEKEGTTYLIQTIVFALGCDLDWKDAPDLRVLHYRKAGRNFYFMVNEGEEPLEGDLSIRSAGALELWDPLDGSIRPWPGCLIEGRTHTSMHLERRQGLVLVVNPEGIPDPDVQLPSVPGEVLVEVLEPWRVMDLSGHPVSAPCPGDWASVRGWETFSGTLRFVTEFEMPGGYEGRAVFLDLGRVGDIAEVMVNDQPVGVRAWAPYIFEVGRVCRPGMNTLEVRVTNSMANAFDGLQMASGLMGSVVIRGAR
jgi:hypothetical protein